ncbi:spectrin beta chain, non-erythrocytic 4-like [Chlamydotis macqueenii]
MATALHKPLKCPGEEFYREALEHCRSYNARLCAERSTRLPFLDSQTGVAQNNCYIWMERTHRGPGLAPGQIYTYPARCWRKKRRLSILEDPRLRPYCEAPLKKEGGLPEGPVLEALLCAEPLEKKAELKEEEAAAEGPKQPPSDFPHDPDGDELEDDPPRRKNKAKGKAYGLGAVRKRQDPAALEERDKPYVCDICGKRYKNRPGLSYHYTHTHLAEEEGEEQGERLAPPRRNHHKREDVSSVELLMNDHQSLKSEMEARGKSIAACLELGKTLILGKSPAADEVPGEGTGWARLQLLGGPNPSPRSLQIKAHVEKLLVKKKEMMEKWDKHWEWLQQMLEVHQFAQEAVVADAWLTAQEPLLKSQELGSSVDEVEQLIRRHEAFRKAAAAWEESGAEQAASHAAPQPQIFGGAPGGLVAIAGGFRAPGKPPLEPRVAYVRHELRPERLQPKLDRVQGSPEDGGPGGEPPPTATADETPPPPKAEEPGEARAGLLERRRERRECRLERQESSEPEAPRQDGKGSGKATLADIVEQLQEKEAGGPSPAPPRERDSPARLPAGPEGLPERTPRPDRPRARDRPKPRRRPRPKDPAQGPGETRRSRSAPAQGSAPPPPPPPTHTVQHEGFLFRKHELDGPNKKASNRSWVNLYCVLSKGDLGFYKDAKGQAAGSTHGGEPLLNLHHSTSEVASDYKKKKNVFKLKTSDGSEFLLQAKDEEDMRGWLRALAACAQEHAEVARWNQGLLTTSSTDEGLPRREGDRHPSTSGRRK